MHKTGSSTIQEYLQYNNGKLGSGIFYADLGPANHSGPLTYALRFDPATDSEISRFGLTPKKLQENVDFFKEKLIISLNRDYSQIIFSSESLVKLTEKELESFKKLLLQYVDEIKVYCYAREPIPFMTSAFQQVIKTGPTQPYSQDICPNYKVKFSKFESVFGNVNYRIFSKLELVGGDVVEDFCKWLNLSLYPFKNVNVSLGALAVKFLYRFQHLRKNIVVSQPDLEMLESNLASLPFHKVVLPIRDVLDLIQVNMSDFEWMKSRFEEACQEFNIEYNNCGAGTIYGAFSQGEKENFDFLERTPEFSDYILKETGYSIKDILTKPLSYLSNLEFRVRRVSSSSIGGWACYMSDYSLKAVLKLYINGNYIAEVIANKHRPDIAIENEGSYVGFHFDFNNELTNNDILSVMVGENILFSGYI
jgi:hypothetical protein